MSQSRETSVELDSWIAQAEVELAAVTAAAHWEGSGHHVRLQVRREDLQVVAGVLRDRCAFEMASGANGVHYPAEADAELHVVYHLVSVSTNRRLQLETTAPDADPQIPSLVSVWPSLDWHEREAWDMFGIVFSGHPSLTRILMPDDWDGHPQRKDYPLGGIPVEYKGATIAPPDQRGQR